MKKRTVAAFLVGALIFSPGCYPWAPGTDRQRIAVSRRMPESRRIKEPRPPMTDAQRGKLYKGIGEGAAGVGALLLLMGESEASEEGEEDKGLLYGSLSLVAVGGLLWCYGEALAPMTDEERGRLYKGIGGCAAGLGGGLLLIPLFATMGASEEEQEELRGLLYGSLGLVALGGLLWCHGDALAHRESKRTKLHFAPNGCMLTCRF